LGFGLDLQCYFVCNVLLEEGVTDESKDSSNLRQFRPLTRARILVNPRVMAATGVIKGYRLCVLSAKGTRPNPDSAVPDLLCEVSKQQVARVDAEGHLNATVG
jgi:hypothetical protein